MKLGVVSPNLVTLHLRHILKALSWDLAWVRSRESENEIKKPRIKKSKETKNIGPKTRKRFD